jgi:N-ethylmaleimide reductase
MAQAVLSTSLFQPVTLGQLTLKNSIVMAPLTRGRAHANGVPSDRMAQYYSLRAQAGLIITEATAISRQGYGWVNAPALFTDEQVNGWQPVIQAVHDHGGLIVCQLWHMGRISHSDFLEGALPVAPSALAAEGHTYTPQGTKPFEVPHALTVDEIQAVIADYVTAAQRAHVAGFDGIEIHAANGYLLDEFLKSGTNQRTDHYGGPIENRIRLVLEVVQAVSQVWPAGRVGVRVSPVSPKYGMADDNPVALYQALAQGLNPFNLAYLHSMEAQPGHMLAPANQTQWVTPAIRQVYTGKLIGCGGYTRELAETALTENQLDAVAFGVPFIANPDLVNRFAQNAPLNPPRPDLFYSEGDEGYLDYPLLEQTN